MLIRIVLIIVLSCTTCVLLNAQDFYSRSDLFIVHLSIKTITSPIGIIIHIHILLDRAN